MSNLLGNNINNSISAPGKGRTIAWAVLLNPFAHKWCFQEFSRWQISHLEPETHFPIEIMFK